MSANSDPFRDPAITLLAPAADEQREPFNALIDEAMAREFPTARTKDDIVALTIRQREWWSVDLLWLSRSDPDGRPRSP